MARRTFGINTKRQNITVPAVGEIGCARFEPEDCCDGGSGSGSGSGCFTACDQCPGGMAEVWTVTVDGYDDAVLYRDTTGDNLCAFNSVDLSWRLHLDHETEVWFLVNNDDESMWYLLAGDWVCAGPNEFLNDLEGGPAATLTADPGCVLGWNCVDGTCVEAEGGTYATLEECESYCTATVIPGGETCPDGANLIDYGNFLLESGPAGEPRYWYLEVTPGTRVHIRNLAYDPDSLVQLFAGDCDPGGCCDSGVCDANVIDLFVGQVACKDYVFTRGRVCVIVSAISGTDPVSMVVHIDAGGCCTDATAGTVGVPVNVDIPDYSGHTVFVTYTGLTPGTYHLDRVNMPTSGEGAVGGVWEWDSATETCVDAVSVTAFDGDVCSSFTVTQDSLYLIITPTSDAVHPVVTLTLDTGAC